MDVLSQLLQSDEPSELEVIHQSLMQLFKKNPKGKMKVLLLTIFFLSNRETVTVPDFITGLFTQVRAGTEEVIKDKVLDFLLRKLKGAEAKALMKKEAEIALFNEIKACLTVRNFTF